MKVSIEPGKYFFYLRNREHYIGYNIEQSNLAGMTIYIKIHSVGTIHELSLFFYYKKNINNFKLLGCFIRAGIRNNVPLNAQIKEGWC